MKNKIFYLNAEDVKYGSDTELLTLNEIKRRANRDEVYGLQGAKFVKVKIIGKARVIIPKLKAVIKTKTL